MKGKLDLYCIFIASRHFETIEDHINLIKTTKRFQFNITKFHYNPISLTKTTRKFFTHLQTLYLYNEEDDIFENDEQIIKREFHYPVNYTFAFEQQQNGNECKIIKYTKEDHEYYNNLMKQSQIHENSVNDIDYFHDQLPNNIHIVDDKCFYTNTSLQSLQLPNSITSLSKQSFRDCYFLSSLTLSTNLKSIGEECFMNCISLKSLSIPKSTTSIETNAFCNCLQLSQLTLCENIKRFGLLCFCSCECLTSLHIPSHWSLHGERIFTNEKELISFEISGNIQMINNKKVSIIDHLTSYTVNSTVTSIGKECFVNCYFLKSLNISSNVKTIDENAISYCPQLTSLSLPKYLSCLKLNIRECDKLLFHYY